MDEIIPRLVKLGYRLTIEDLRTAPKYAPKLIDANVYAHVGHADTGEPTVLRHYQISGVNALIEHGCGLLLASTGSGKTLICTALVDAYGKCGVKTITIVPNQDLIQQTKADYIHYGLDVGEYSGTNKTLEHQHIVSTWQALKNNAKIIEMFQLVLVDEAHGSKGPALSQILTDHAASIMYRFGVTGTLPKDPSDQMAIAVALGPVRETISARQLIDEGVLSELHIDIMQLEEDLQQEYQQFCVDEPSMSKPPTYKQFKDGYFPDYDAEKSYIHRNGTRHEWIADMILAKQDQKKGNTMVLVDNITFGRKLAALIPGAIFVNGQDVKKSTERTKIYQMFKDHDDLVVIATVHIAGTGLSIRRINNLVLIDIGKSFIRVIQAIGRGLRTASDKNFVHITDICSDLKYGRKHLTERTKFYTDAQYPHKKHKINYVKMMSSVDDL